MELQGPKVHQEVHDQIFLVKAVIQPARETESQTLIEFGGRKAEEILALLKGKPKVIGVVS